MSIWVTIGVVVLVILIIIAVLELPSQHRFIDSCGAEDPAKLIKGLKAGADPNKPGMFGLTPQGEAVVAKRTANVRLLIEAGAMVQPSEPKRTPLHASVEANTLEIAEILLNAGADPNFKDKSGRSAFIEACTALNLDMAKLMLQHGADVNVSVGNEGKNPEPLIVVVVAQSSNQNSAETVEQLCQMIALLLDNGASVNARSAEGAPLLGLALPELDVLRLLIDRGAIADVAWDGIELKDVIANLLTPNPDAPKA